MGAYEWLIARPYLKRTQGLTDWCKMAQYLKRGEHIYVYRKDVSILEKGQWEGAQVLQVIPREDDTVVGQLERKARVVFNGMR